MKISLLGWMLIGLLGFGFSQTQKPNIIFLLTDDQRWDMLGVMGNPIIKTPNLDKLAGEGTLFENAYVTTAICWASRATIFTGQHTSRHGIGNGGAGSLSRAQVAKIYPSLLRQAGYRTGFIGKVGVGGVNSSDFDIQYEFDNKYEIKENGKVVGHVDTKMGDQAIDFLDKTSRSQPFNLNISFKAPHEDISDPRRFIPDPAFNGYYVDDVIPVTKTMDPAFFAALPEFLRNSLMRTRWNQRFATPEKYQETVKNHHRLLTGVDAVVGKLVAKLKAMDIYDNTIIVYMGDNGFFLGERGFAGKWMAYEHSIRVPLIVYDPRNSQNKRGIRRKEMALNLDIAPTLLSVAGVEIPKQMQGRNLLPLIANEVTEWRKEFYHEHPIDMSVIPKSRAIIGDRYKYIVYYEQNPPYEELYDYVNDPDEANNLIKSATHNSILADLKGRLAALQPAAASADEVPFLQKQLVYGCMNITDPKYNGSANVHVRESCEGSSGIFLSEAVKKIQINGASITIPMGFRHSIRITDIRGRLVFSASGEGAQEYSLSTLKNPGLYIVKVNFPEDPNIRMERVIYQIGTI